MKLEDIISKDDCLSLSVLAKEQAAEKVISYITELVNIYNEKSKNSQETLWEKIDPRLKLTADIYGNKAKLANYQRLPELKFDAENKILMWINPQKNTQHICLPLALIVVAFNKSHSHLLAGNFGITKTYGQIEKYFFFPGIYKWVKMLIADCQTCQKDKVTKRELATAPLNTFFEHTPHVNYRISIDCKGRITPKSEGCTYIVVMVDAFSHFVQAIPVEQITGEIITKTVLREWIHKFGVPTIIVHDQGTEFINKTFLEFCSNFGIRLHPRTSHAPWTNGLAENRMRYLGRYIRAYLDQLHKDNWADIARNFLLL